MIEYDDGKARAIVEYKNEHAKTQYASHPSYKAMIDLGNRANLPVIACRYKDDYSKWRAVPLDSSAKIFLPNSKVMTEREWVSFLYKIRGKELPEGILDDNNVEI
jgi:proteasome lid subunit RPN8/RPN11